MKQDDVTEALEALPRLIEFIAEIASIRCEEPDAPTLVCLRDRARLVLAGEWPNTCKQKTLRVKKDWPALWAAFDGSAVQRRALRKLWGDEYQAAFVEFATGRGYWNGLDPATIAATEIEDVISAWWGKIESPEVVARMDVMGYEQDAL